jgi:hypothetical protein
MMTEKQTIKELFKMDCQYNPFGYGSHHWSRTDGELIARCQHMDCEKTVALDALA